MCEIDKSRCPLNCAQEIERNADHLEAADEDAIRAKLQSADACVKHSNCHNTSYCTIAIAGLLSRLGRRFR